MSNIDWTDLIPMKAHYKHPLVDRPMATTEAQLKLFIAEGLNPHRHLSGCQCEECKDPAMQSSPADDEDELE